MKKKSLQNKRDKDSKVVRITIEVPERLRKALKAKIAIEGTSITYIMRGFIEHYLGDKRGQNGTSSI